MRALILASLLAACSDRDAAQRARADSDLARDLALVQSSARAQPIFRDTALTNAPAPLPSRGLSAPGVRPASRVARPREVTRSRQTARPVPQREQRRPTEVTEVRPAQPNAPTPETAEAERAGESRVGSIGAGAVLAASSNARVCTRSNLPGDRITATVNTPAHGTNGAEIPAGAKVVLEVTSIDGGEPPAEGQVVFRVTSVAIGDESYPASGGATASGSLERVAGPRNAASDRKKVIGGAIAGAILGQMMGKDTRSTVIGAAAGAAAGTAAAKMGDRGESCLPAGTPLRIVLDEAVVIR
jgi:hypothetical protein